jgi:hypothetical protein
MRILRIVLREERGALEHDNEETFVAVAPKPKEKPGIT